MDLRNFFYDQLVAEDELDEVESLVEKAIGKIAEDWGFEQYLMKYLKPTETGTPDMYIHVAANAAYVKESVAITHLVPVRWATTQDINCALDYLSVSTIPSAGNKRYISVFAKFVRDESNQKIDGHGTPIWYNRNEGFEIEVWSGVEDPSPSKLALKSETYVLLFDVLLDENSTAISEPADWDNPVVDEIDITRVLYSEQVLKKASSQTIDGDLTVEGELTYRGNTVVGMITPFIHGYFADGSNGSFSAVGYSLPDWWKECDGSALNDSDSPIFNGAGRYLPNLTDDRFLMGNTVEGNIGGDNVMAHTHGFTQPSAHAITYPNHKHQVGDYNFGTARHNIGYRSNGNDKLYITINKPEPVNTQLPNSRVEASVAESSTEASYSKTDGGGSCSVTNNHSGGAVNAATNDENRPTYLSCKYIMRIK